MLLYVLFYNILLYLFYYKKSNILERRNPKQQIIH